jgi:arylsulfatase A-like enzyme
MSEIAVIGFHDSHRALQVMGELWRLNEGLGSDLDTALVLPWGSTRKLIVRPSVNLSTGEGVRWGRFWGALIRVTLLCCHTDQMGAAAKATMTAVDDATEDPRWGRVGKQRIEDTGPLNRSRMETCDDEFCAAAKDFIKRQHKAGKPFFCWVNTTHMHFRTHTKPSSLGQAGRWQSPYHDTMVDHDKNVGDLLSLLDELGIADNTFVMYSTDNGPHMNSWPDAGMTPFRSEKNTNWEGAFRVPLLVRWTAKVPAGVTSNEIVQHNDWLPTFLAIAGEPNIKDKLLKGHQAAGKTFKVHLDGFNLLPYLTGQEKKSPRHGFIYFDDDGDLVGLRFDNWKIVFMEQRCEGTMRIWAEPFTTLRVPKLFNLRTDPFERADLTSNTYYDWFMWKGYMIMAAQGLVGQFLETFKAFPPGRKRRASPSIRRWRRWLPPPAAPDTECVR